MRPGKMYWTETHTGEIERANLDGSGREIVLQVPVVGGAFLRAVHVDSRMETSISVVAISDSSSCRTVQQLRFNLSVR